MTTAKKGTAQDFAAKILHEGGIYGAFDYGLDANAYDLPSSVIIAWEDARQAFHTVEALITVFETRAKQAGIELE